MVVAALRLRRSGDDDRRRVGAPTPLSIVTAFGMGLPWRVQAVAPRETEGDGWHRAGVVLERHHDRIVVLFATENGSTAVKPGTGSAPGGPVAHARGGH